MQKSLTFEVEISKTLDDKKNIFHEIAIGIFKLYARLVVLDKKDYYEMILQQLCSLCFNCQNLARELGFYESLDYFYRVLVQVTGQGVPVIQRFKIIRQYETELNCLEAFKNAVQIILASSLLSPNTDIRNILFHLAQDVELVFHTLAKVLNIQIILYTNQYNYLKFPGTCPQNLPIIAFLRTDDRFHLISTRAMKEIEENPQKAFSNPDLFLILNHPDQANIILINNPGDFFASSSQRVIDSFIDQGPSKKSFELVPFQNTIEINKEPSELFEVISNLAQISLQNKFFNTKTINSLEKAIEIYPELKNQPYIEEFLNLPKNISRNIEKTVNYPSQIPLNITNKLIRVSEKSLSSVNKVQCEICKSLKKENLINVVKCPKDCKICAKCRELDLSQCFVCKRKYNNSEKNIIGIYSNSSDD